MSKFVELSTKVQSIINAGGVIRGDYNREGISAAAAKCFDSAFKEGSVFEIHEFKGDDIQRQVKEFSRSIHGIKNLNWVPRIKNKASDLYDRQKLVLDLVLGRTTAETGGLTDSFRGIALLKCYKTGNLAIYLSTYSRDRQNTFINRFDLSDIVHIGKVSDNGTEDFVSIASAMSQGTDGDINDLISSIKEDMTKKIYDEVLERVKEEVLKEVVVNKPVSNDIPELTEKVQQEEMTINLNEPTITETPVATEEVVKEVTLNFGDDGQEQVTEQKEDLDFLTDDDDDDDLY